EAGCYSVEFGLQTWNPVIRRDVLARHETNAAALAAFRHCAEQRLWFDVDHMFGLPGESEQDHVEGALAYRGLAYLNRVKVHQLVYLPTAEIVARAVDHGVLSDELCERLADGVESDFYDSASGDDEPPELVSGFAALYELLPALPTAALHWLLAKRRVRHLRHIPAPVMAALQALLAIRSGDLRFLVYAGHYPQRLWRAAVDRLAFPPLAADCRTRLAISTLRNSTSFARRSILRWGSSASP